MKSTNNTNLKESVDYFCLTESEFNAKLHHSTAVLLVKVISGKDEAVFYFEMLKKYKEEDMVAEIEKDVSIILNARYQLEVKRWTIYLT